MENNGREEFLYNLTYIICFIILFVLIPIISFFIYYYLLGYPIKLLLGDVLVRGLSLFNFSVVKDDIPLLCGTIGLILGLLKDIKIFWSISESEE